MSKTRAFTSRGYLTRARRRKAQTPPSSTIKRKNCKKCGTRSLKIKRVKNVK